MTYDHTQSPDDRPDWKKRAYNILRDMFEGIYIGEWKGMKNSARTRMDGFLDALYGVTGKADAYKIRIREKIPDLLGNVIQGADSVVLYENGFPDSAKRILKRVQGINDYYERTVPVRIAEGSGVWKASPPQSVYDENGALILNACKHICRTDVGSFDRFWIDEWGNFIVSEADYLKCREYPAAFNRFRTLFEERIRDCMERIGGDYSSV